MTFQELKTLATSIAVNFGTGSELKIPFGFFDFQIEGGRLFTNERNGIHFQIKPVDIDPNFAVLTLFVDGKVCKNEAVALEPFYSSGKDITKKIVAMCELPECKTRITLTGVFGSYVSSISTLGTNEFIIMIAFKDGEGSRIELYREYKGDTEVGKLAYLYLTLKHSNQEVMLEPNNLDTHMAFLFTEELFDYLVSRKVYDLITKSVSNSQFWTPFDKG
jgi:hypothetical protein